jgi:hypothetical protein
MNELLQKLDVDNQSTGYDYVMSNWNCLVFSFNQLDLPAYETNDKLKNMLLLSINECSEGFGLA